MDIKALDQKAKKLAKEYIDLEKDLLEVIIQLDQSKAFYQLGYSSLFSYITKALKFSPAVTYNFINVARKAFEVPELKNQVKTGKLSIYKAQKMTSVLTKENYKQWFELAAKKNHRELEKEVARVSPTRTNKEKVRFIHPQEEGPEKTIIKRDIPRVELQMGLSEKLMLKLRRAQDLESQKRRTNLSLEETLEKVLNLYLEKRDPLKVAQRQKSRGRLRGMDKNSSRELSTKLESKKKRQPIPKLLIHQVQLRDQGRCTHVDHDGQRCTSRRYLEIHHKRPVSQGGVNTLENLKLLCSGHHKVHHLASHD